MPDPVGRNLRTARRLLACCAALACLRAVSAQGDAAFVREHEIAARAILCDCGCSPQSVHDCACGRAAEMRDQLAAEIRAGKSGREVIEARVARQGAKILIAPPVSGFNLVAWLGPGLALFVGIALTVLLIRRWRRSSVAGDAPVTVLTAADDAYVARLERELRESP